MSCYFLYRSCCNNQCNCRRCGFNVPSTPIIPPMPIIPQPTPQVASVASFVLTPATEVAADSDLPISMDVVPDTASYRLVGNSVLLQSGYYLVSYAANAASETEAESETDDEIGLALTLNGAVVTKSQSFGSTPTSVFLLYVPANGSTVSLRNIGTEETTFSNVNLVFQKQNI